MAIGNGETLPRARSFDNEPSYEIRYRYESDRRRKFKKRVTKSIYNRFWPTRTHTSSAPIVIDDAGTTITVVLEHFRLLFFFPPRATWSLLVIRHSPSRIRSSLRDPRNGTRLLVRACARRVDASMPVCRIALLSRRFCSILPPLRALIRSRDRKKYLNARFLGCENDECLEFEILFLKRVVILEPRIES